MGFSHFNWHSQMRAVEEVNPEVIALVKRLRRRNPRTGRRKSLRAISREIADLGYRNIHDEPFAAESIAGMIRQARRI